MALMPLLEARRIAHRMCGPLEAEAAALFAALGQMLAGEVVAPRDVPGCDNSAMDGYAVQAAQTQGATRERPARLRVVETIYAGARPRFVLGPGEAARIFTGAPLPQGADAVVRQEATRGGEDEVEVVVEVERGDHVRRQGEEIAAGQRLFGPGVRVDAAVVGVLASLGIETATVIRRPKVAVLTVGDELLSPGQVAAPHQIYDSNGVLLSAMAVEAGAVVVDLSRASDAKRVLEARIREALSHSDLLVTSGGASVGDKDLVKDALRALGADLLVDGVALKPGKPAGLAVLGDKPVVILPGNPGAAAVVFDQLARPVLLALQGVREARRRVMAKLDSTQRKQPGLTYLLSAQLEEADGEPHARVRPQGAGQLLQNVGMQGWAILPPGRSEYRRGEWVELELLAGPEWLALGEADPSPPGARWAPAFAVVGWSGAGKTTLLERLLPELGRRGIAVAVVKHSSHPHPLQPEQSDSARLLAAGAASASLAVPGAVQRTAKGEVDRAVAELRRSGHYDLVLVEGWKDGPLSKIEVWREGLEPPLYTGRRDVVAVVSGAPLQSAPPRFDPQDVVALAELLLGGR